MSVRTTDVLEWLRKSLEGHSEHTQPRVQAAWLAEREKWLPLIREAIEAEDGVLVDAYDVGADWVDCGDLETGKPELLAGVESVLDVYNTRYPEANLRVEFDGGRARIAGDQEYEAASAAQQAIRDVAAALCSRRLSDADLVAIAYSEASLEYEHVRVLWELLMRLPVLLGMTTGTVMVVACEGTLRIPIHCTGDPSLRARVGSEGISWRHSWERSALPFEVAARQEESAMPLFVLFLGAGASTGFGLPSGDSFRNEVLSRLMNQSVDESTFEAVAREWWTRLQVSDQLTEQEQLLGVDLFVETLTLEVVLEHEQQEEGQRYSSSLRRFATMHDEIVEKIRQRDGSDDPLRRLVALKKHLVLVTVNFDQVIEARCDPGDIRTFTTESELAEFPGYLDTYLRGGGPVPLLKMHGDIHLPETIVANISSTSAGLSTARFDAIHALISRQQSNVYRPWWYVGYSMRDRDLDTVWRDPRMYSFHEQWIAPFLDPNVATFIKSYRLRGWSDGRLIVSGPAERLVSWTADDAFAELYRTVGPLWA